MSKFTDKEREELEKLRHLFAQDRAKRVRAVRKASLFPFPLDKKKQVDVHKLVKRLMLSFGVSVYKLGLATGLNEQTIHNFLGGKNDMGFSGVCKVLSCLGITISFSIGFDGGVEEEGLFMKLCGRRAAINNAIEKELDDMEVLEYLEDGELASLFESNEDGSVNLKKEGDEENE
jgi:hypothetical protein